MDNRAAYLQGKWVWDNRWVLKAGVRKENTDIAVDSYSTLRLCRSATQCSVPVDVTGGELDYQSTTYNIGLRYTANDAFNPFIAYSEGFDISDLGRLLRTAQVTDIAQVRTEASIVKHYEVRFQQRTGTTENRICRLPERVRTRHRDTARPTDRRLLTGEGTAGDSRLRIGGSLCCQ